MIGVVLFALAFLYSLCGTIASRLFERYDPSSKYSDVCPLPIRRADGTKYTPQSPRDSHKQYIFFGSLFWPVSLVLWVLFFLPRRIVLRVERVVDKPESEDVSKSVYR